MQGPSHPQESSPVPALSHHGSPRASSRLTLLHLPAQTLLPAHAGTDLAPLQGSTGSPPAQPLGREVRLCQPPLHCQGNMGKPAEMSWLLVFWFFAKSAHANSPGVRSHSLLWDGADPKHRRVPREGQGTGKQLPHPEQSCAGQSLSRHPLQHSSLQASLLAPGMAAHTWTQHLPPPNPPTEGSLRTEKRG